MTVYAAAVASLGIGAGAAAAGGAQVTLELPREVARYGSTVTFTGAVTPAARTRVEIVLEGGGESRAVAAGDSNADGTYSLSAVARAPGSFVARAAGAASRPATLRVEPLVRARFRGPRLVGARLEVAGRVAPARAGAVLLQLQGRTRAVRVDRRGRFRAAVTSAREGRVRVAVRLRPADGFVSVRRVRSTGLRAPVLRPGTTGAAVRFFEQRLRALRYALRAVDRSYGSDTVEAVYALQKLAGLPRDGVAGTRVWRALARARTPRATVPLGDHIEVDKGLQLLFEVRRGRVVSIVHVSTGATGNTPLGRWRVYAKSPSFNAVGMYYSLFFLRGFAIHGYRSVPPFPASHGCVRLPLWYAPGLYSRWGVGATIWVFP